MLPILTVAQAVSLLQEGEVLAYPTEAVYGLGCLPRLKESVYRILSLKKRPVEKGLILVAATMEQLKPLLDLRQIKEKRLADILKTWPGPYTWVFPATEQVPHWITGSHHSVAVRLSAHPVVQALCLGLGSPIVSTSANVATEPPLGDLELLRQVFSGKISGVVAGDLGGLGQPTSVQDAITNRILRA